MTTVVRAVWTRFPLYTLGIGFAVIVVSGVIGIGPAEDPCSVDVLPGDPHLTGGVSSAGSAVVAYAGLLVAVASLACAVLRLAAFLRDPGRETRWAAGGRIFFLVFPMALVLLGFLNVDGVYDLGHMVYCA